MDPAPKLRQYTAKMQSLAREINYKIPGNLETSPTQKVARYRLGAGE
jgi:hypothetical protein